MRFMLIYSPTHLFLIPGFIIMILGLLLLILLLTGPVKFLGHRFDIHFNVLGGILTLLGYQIINLGIYAKAISYNQNTLIEDKFITGFFKKFNLEKGLYLGLAIFLIGFFINLWILIVWIQSGFGELSLVREALLGLILIVVGIQTIFSSFLLSMLQIDKGK